MNEKIYKNDVGVNILAVPPAPYPLNGKCRSQNFAMPKMFGMIMEYVTFKSRLLHNTFSCVSKR